MAVILKQVLRLIRNKIPTITSEFYEHFAPESAADLHIVYNLISNNMTFGFTKDYEKVRIQFSVFDRYQNTERILDYMSQLEMLFDAKTYPMPNEGEGGIQGNCIYKNGENLQYLEEDEFYQGTMDFIFFVQKNKGEDDETSSSGDSNSSSSDWSGSSYSSSTSSATSSSSSSSSYLYSTSSWSSSSSESSSSSSE